MQKRNGRLSCCMLLRHTMGHAIHHSIERKKKEGCHIQFNSIVIQSCLLLNQNNHEQTNQTTMTTPIQPTQPPTTTTTTTWKQGWLQKQGYERKKEHEQEREQNDKGRKQKRYDTFHRIHSTYLLQNSKHSIKIK